ncbi:MAG: TetR/AcrR family transcriptional regulator [Rhodoferax sp.]
MRTTKDQQDRTRRALLQAAADLMTRQGLDATSMKQIARAAGVGDATIYHYFSSKEQLLLGFLALQVDDAVQHWRATPELSDFDLREQLQSLVDAVLAQLLPEREFVGLLQRHLQGGALLWSQALPGRAALAAQFGAVLEQAQGRGEIAPLGFAQALGALLADYSLGVVAYWLRDTSPHFGDTTRLIDLSLDLLVLVLRTGLVNKLLELGGFVLRSQMARVLQPGSAALDWLALARGGLQAAAGASAGTGAAPWRAAPQSASAPPRAAAAPSRARGAASPPAKPRARASAADADTAAADAAQGAAPAMPDVAAPAPRRRTRKEAP